MHPVQQDLLNHIARAADDRRELDGLREWMWSHVQEVVDLEDRSLTSVDGHVRLLLAELDAGDRTWDAVAERLRELVVAPSRRRTSASRP